MPAARAVALLGMLAACGDNQELPDAGAPPDTEVGLVRIRYLGDTLPSEVVFQNADSSVVLVGHSDADGRANAFMAPGGFVSVVVPNGNTRWIYTIADVAPGEELRVYDRFSTTAAKSTPLTIKVPVATESSYYQLNSSCGFADIRGAELSEIPVSLDDCGDHADLLVLALGPTYEYLYREDVPVGAGRSVTFDEPYRGLERARIHITNVPPGVNELFATQSLMGEGRELWGPRTTDSGFGKGRVSVVDGRGELDHDMLLPTTGTMLTQLDLARVTTIGEQHVLRWGPPASSVSLDYGAALLRNYTALPHYLFTDHTLRWAEGSSGKLADGVLASFGWYRASTFTTTQWVILAPRTAEPVVRLPVLPFEELQPRAGDQINDPFLLTSIAIDGGFPRLTKSSLIGRFGSGQAWPVEGASGEVGLQELGPTRIVE